MARRGQGDAPRLAVATGEALLPAITSRADGAILSVVAAPRSSVTAFAGIEGDALRVRVAAPPVDGAANAALVRLCAEAAGVPRSAVTIVSGGGARRKRLLFAGLCAPELARRLGPYVPG